MSKLSLSLAAALLLAGPALACPGEKGEQTASAIQDVQLETLHGWVQEKSVTVVDANKKETFAEGHIPGSIHMRYDNVDAAALPKEKDARMAFYCYSEQCGASKKVAKKVEALGYTNLFVFKGGIEAWKKAGYETAKAAPAKKEEAKKTET